MQPRLSEAPAAAMATGPAAAAAQGAVLLARTHVTSFPLASLDDVALQFEPEASSSSSSSSGGSSNGSGSGSGSSSGGSSSGASSPTVAAAAAAAAECHTATPGHHRAPALLESAATASPSDEAAAAQRGSSGSLAPADSTSHQQQQLQQQGSSTPVRAPLPVAVPPQCSLMLQVPDFAVAFSLPEECCFAESTVDESVAVPTPHTPVVASVFVACDGQQAAPLQAHHQRHGSGGSSSSSSCSGQQPSPQQACAGGERSTHQLGVLQLDTDVECGPDRVPAAAVPTSPCAAGHHTTQHHPQGSSWELPLFVSLLSRRTLSAVLEADNEGVDDETATAAAVTGSSSRGVGREQQQAQQQTSQQQKPAAGEEQELTQDEAVDASAVVLEVCCAPTNAGTAAEQREQAAQEGDEWAAANKVWLRELQQQQQQCQVLSYPQLLARLLPPPCDSSSSSSSSSSRSSSRASKQSSLLQRLQRLQRLLCGCISCPAAGSSSGSPEAAALLALARVQLQGGDIKYSLQQGVVQRIDALHDALLQAVFSAWTGSSCPVPRCGPHWATLGFQGDHPGTDLRGAGLLGLLQLLWLAHAHAHAAAAILSLSNSLEHHFPLACVSVNISVWTLTALRAGRLDSAAARLGGHVAAANRFYAGAFTEFAARWRAGGKTMADAGHVLRQLQRWCATHTRQVLKQGTCEC